MAAAFIAEPTGACSFCGRAGSERPVVGVADRPWRACAECVGIFIDLIDRFETGTPAPPRTTRPTNHPTSAEDFGKMMEELAAKNLALHRQLGMPDDEIERRREWARISNLIRADLLAPASTSNGGRRSGDLLHQMHLDQMPRPIPITCSFCDATFERGRLLPGPHVAICADCARSAGAQLG